MFLVLFAFDPLDSFLCLERIILGSLRLPEATELGGKPQSALHQNVETARCRAFLHDALHDVPEKDT